MNCLEFKLVGVGGRVKDLATDSTKTAQSERQSGSNHVKMTCESSLFCTKLLNVTNFESTKRIKKLLDDCIDIKKIKNAEAADAPIAKQSSGSQRITGGAGDQSAAAPNIFDRLTITCKSYATSRENEIRIKKLSEGGLLDDCIDIKYADAGAFSDRQASGHQGVKMIHYESSQSSGRDEKVEHFNFTSSASSKISSTGGSGSCHKDTCTSQQVVVVGMVEEARVTPEAFACQTTAARTSSSSPTNTRTIDAHLDLSTTIRDDRERHDTTTLEEERDWNQEIHSTSTSTSVSASVSIQHSDEDLAADRKRNGGLDSTIFNVGTAASELMSSACSNSRTSPSSSLPLRRDQTAAFATTYTKRNEDSCDEDELSDKHVNGGENIKSMINGTTAAQHESRSSFNCVKMTHYESSRSSSCRDEKVQHLNLAMSFTSSSSPKPKGESCHDNMRTSPKVVVTGTSPKVVVVGMVEDARVAPGACTGQATAARTSILSLINMRMIKVLRLSSTADDRYDYMYDASLQDDWIQASTDTSTSVHQPDKDLEASREHSAGCDSTISNFDTVAGEPMSFACSSSRAASPSSSSSTLREPAPFATPKTKKGDEELTDASFFEGRFEMKNAATDAFSRQQVSGTERIKGVENQTKAHQSKSHNNKGETRCCSSHVNNGKMLLTKNKRITTNFSLTFLYAMMGSGNGSETTAASAFTFSQVTDRIRLCGCRWIAGMIMLVLVTFYFDGNHPLRSMMSSRPCNQQRRRKGKKEKRNFSSVVSNVVLLRGLFLCMLMVGVVVNASAAVEMGAELSSLVTHLCSSHSSNSIIFLPTKDFSQLRSDVGSFLVAFLLAE